MQTEFEPGTWLDIDEWVSFSSGDSVEQTYPINSGGELSFWGGRYAPRKRSPALVCLKLEENWKEAHLWKGESIPEALQSACLVCRISYSPSLEQVQEIGEIVSTFLLNLDSRIDFIWRYKFEQELVGGHREQWRDSFYSSSIGL